MRVPGKIGFGLGNERHTLLAKDAQHESHEAVLLIVT
jgi:hypothetical protein